jgi:hypothetical protein
LSKAAVLDARYLSRTGLTGRPKNAEARVLRKLSGGGNDCKNGTCPTLWGTEDEKMCLVQGYVVTDPEYLAQLDLPEGESVVMVPVEVLERYFSADR